MRGIIVGGLNAKLVDTAAICSSAFAGYHVADERLQLGFHPDNPVNLPSARGVQVELPRVYAGSATSTSCFRGRSRSSARWWLRWSNWRHVPSSFCARRRCRPIELVHRTSGLSSEGAGDSSSRSSRRGQSRSRASWDAPRPGTWREIQGSSNPTPASSDQLECVHHRSPGSIQAPIRGTTSILVAQTVSIAKSGDQHCQLGRRRTCRVTSSWTTAR